MWDFLLGFYEGFTGETVEETMFSGCFGCFGKILKYLFIIGVIVVVLYIVFK